jgi:hypothetical protein
MHHKHDRAYHRLFSEPALVEDLVCRSYQPGMRYYLIDESRYPEGKQGSVSGFVMRLENVGAGGAVRKGAHHYVVDRNSGD